MWESVITALKAWCLAGTGLTLVVLENEERPFVEQAWLYLSVSRVAKLGVDDVGFSEPLGWAEGDQLVHAVSGNRVFTTRIHCDSFSQRANAFAVLHLENMRTASELPRLTALLDAAGVSIVDFGDIETEDYMVDERTISRAGMDVRFNVAVNMVDDPSGLSFGDYVDRVAVSSNLADVPASLQLDNASIPEETP